MEKKSNIMKTANDILNAIIFGNKKFALLDNLFHNYIFTYLLQWKILISLENKD